MDFKSLFRSTGNRLEGTDAQIPTLQKSGDFNCPSCGAPLLRAEVRTALYTCPRCDHYFRIGARRRIELLTDNDSFFEHDIDIVSSDPLTFPGYRDKLSEAEAKSGEREAVITGHATINGQPTAIFSMDGNFMMGSMGGAVGTKLTHLFEYASEHDLPVVGVTISGGARMQEGMISLSQMAKVSGAVKRHSDRGGFYIVLLTNPTTGGVTASFAMLGDVIIAEPRALIGFAGPRVIEQTLLKSLPEGFQSAESLLKCGFIDAIVERPLQKNYICTLLKYHAKKEG